MPSEMHDPMVPIPFKVKKIKRETKDVFTLILFPDSSSSVVPFSPGQFSMLYVLGVGEVPISHSGAPSQSDSVVHTIREVGATTQALGRLSMGDVIGLRGPFGSAWPIETSKGMDIIIGAGGLGMAPLRSLFYYILENREQFGRVRLLYGTRAPEDFLFKNEWDEWQKQGIEILTTVGLAHQKWKGHVGHVTTLVPRLELESQNTRVFLCGPEIMMRFTAFELEKRGVPIRNISVSLERNMKCAIGFCGHCQFGPHFVCKGGPVFGFDQVEALMRIREL